MNVLVVDIGTSSMRGILFAEDGKRLLNHQIFYCPGHISKDWIEQPAKDWENAIVNIVKYISGQAKKMQLTVDVISVTAQRSSVIPLDKYGKPLMPAIMWQDTRNSRLCKGLEKENKLVFNKSGAGVNTVFSGGKMAWVKAYHPDIYKNVYKFVNVPEYVIYLMTGEFRTDTTYGSRSNLMNLRKRSWDPELLKLYGLEEEKLCMLQEPGSICGKVTKEFSFRTGIVSGIPVISAGGDQQCAAVGQGAYQEGVLSVVTGTGAFLISTCGSVPDKLDNRLICNCSAIKGQYILEASVLTCCSAFDWYRRNFYDDGRGGYEKINEELKELYDMEEECIILPYFQGRSTEWNPDAKAFFANVTLSTGRGNLLKALVEGIFMEIRNNIQVMRQYMDISAAYISGGLTNSHVMNQMQADIYRMTLHRMENSESTALGALIVTLVNLGVYHSPQQAFRIIRQWDSMESFDANPDKEQEYKNKISVMNDLYEKIYRH